MVDQDVFIGLLDVNVLLVGVVYLMNYDLIVFVFVNLVLEINLVVVEKVGVIVIVIGFSQYLNQVNNILVFLGFFKGLFINGVK